jgi:hypothetical protein
MISIIILNGLLIQQIITPQQLDLPAPTTDSPGSTVGSSSRLNE